MNDSLPEVPLTRTAKAYRVCGDSAFTACNAPVRLELPSGGVVWLKAGANTSCRYGQGASGYEGDALKGLPALATGWQRDEHGPGVQRFDKQADIARVLDKHNDEVIAFAHAGCGCDLGGRGGGGAAAVLALAMLVAWRRRRSTSN
jgi:MYXO-CTERM domain-containing protein